MFVGAGDTWVMCEVECNPSGKSNEPKIVMTTFVLIVVLCSLQSGYSLTEYYPVVANVNVTVISIASLATKLVL